MNENEIHDPLTCPQCHAEGVNAEIGAYRSAIDKLLEALDRQHFMSQPPGGYHYSMNVKGAMEVARRLIDKPAPAPSHDDVAHEVAR